MCTEFSRALRCTTLTKISWAPAHHAPDRAHPCRDKTAVGQFADPDGKIDMIFQQVDHAVSQHDPDIDVRISLEEFHRHREYVQTAENDGRGDDQAAFRRAVFAGRRALGFSDVLKDAPAGRDIRSASVSQCKLPEGYLPIILSSSI